MDSQMDGQKTFFAHKKGCKFSDHMKPNHDIPSTAVLKCIQACLRNKVDLDYMI